MMLPSSAAARHGQAITAVDVSPIVKGKLLAAGYRFTGDVLDVGAAQLARELDIPPREALQTLKLLRQHAGHGGGASVATAADGETAACSSGRSALELLHDELQPHTAITTCHEELDQLLGGGGVPLTQLTEFCGVPGIGKTQLSMQLAVDVTIPRAFGGLEGRCVYIDTEGSFSIERVVEMAGALVAHLGDSGADAPPPTLEHVLSRIVYYRVHDYIEQLALINLLPELVAQQPDIKLVVVDSVTFHFRHGFDDYGLRTRLLNGSAQTLLATAARFAVAVVIVNQVATRLSADHGPASSIVPALGDSWGHMCTNRVILFWKDQQRHAFLFKSPANRSAVCPYRVTADGIRAGQ